MFFLRRLPLGYRENLGDGTFCTETLTPRVPKHVRNPWSTKYYMLLSLVEDKDDHTKESKFLLMLLHS